jgi:alanyl-tRNA synthetase
MQWDQYNSEKAIMRAGKLFLFKIFSKYLVDDVLSGDDALKILDTLGIPINIIKLLANSHGLTVDQEEFEKLYIHRERSIACATPKCEAEC